MTTNRQIPRDARVRVSNPHDLLHDEYGTVVRVASECAPHACGGDYLVDIDGFGQAWYPPESIEDVSDRITYAPASLQGAVRPARFALGERVYCSEQERSYLVRSARYTAFMGWFYGLSRVDSRYVCTHIAEFALRPYAAAAHRPAITITWDQLETWTGQQWEENTVARINEQLSSSLVPHAIREHAATLNAWA